jgi:RNA-directed DNA polymerase
MPMTSLLVLCTTCISPMSEFLKELHWIIAEQNFHIKESKTRLQKDGYRKEVTGLLVNEKANVQQRYIKQLRMWLYYWERYGYEKASGFFLQQYIADKGPCKKWQVRYGKCYFWET